MKPSTPAAPLERLLEGFQTVQETEDYKKVFDWSDANWWTRIGGLRLDERGLRRQIGHFTNAVHTYEKLTFGSAKSRLTDAKRKELKELTKIGRRVLAGRLFQPVAGFLHACVENDLALPSTVKRINGNAEPCGEKVSYCNIGPEWIRHFLGVLVDAGEFQKITAQKYNPFKSRDHFVHSLLVAAIGHAILAMRVDKPAKAAVAQRLGLSPTALSGVKCVGQLMAQVYSRKFPEIIGTDGFEAGDWLRRIWPAVALWHDAGYDTATWCLLSFREFAHCCSLQSVVRDGAENVLWSCLRELQSVIGSDLPKSIRDALDTPSTGDGYKDMWNIDDHKTQDPKLLAWGRFHALFSAYEFIKRFGNSRPSTGLDPQIKHVAVAIAQHHEQVLHPGVSEGALTDEHMAESFVRNPIGSLLSFADALSGFSRVKVKVNWLDNLVNLSVGRLGKISFSLDFGGKPLRVRMQGTAPNGRPYFYPDKFLHRFFPGKFLRSRMRLKKKALWGVLVE